MNDYPDRLMNLRMKEVINSTNGERYGYVNDVLIDLKTGRITALLLPEDLKVWSIFKRKGEKVIPWEAIRRIGEDIILVDWEEHSEDLKKEKNLAKEKAL